MYSITEGFSPILCCRPDVSSSKNEEEAIPPGGKKYSGTIKPSTKMILVHVQKMYKTCTEDVQYISNIITVNGSVKVRGHAPAWRLSPSEETNI